MHKDIILVSGFAVTHRGFPLDRGGDDTGDLQPGEMKLIPLGVGESAEAVILPIKGLDVGAGPGEEWEGSLEGGIVGVILDGRGRRPFNLPEDHSVRVNKLQIWSQTLDTYPERFLSMGGGK